MARKRPNILMITPDEWRGDALGCAGNSIVRTPCIDALAKSGVLFRNAYTTAPMCVPARMSILTGQSPRVHGAMTNGLSPTDNVSIAAVLRENGYRTSAFGKMHFLPAYCDFGFEVLQLSEQDGEGWRIDDYHRWLWETHGLVDWIDLWDQVEDYRNEAPSWFRGTYGALKSPIPEEAYHTTWITDRFLEYLDGLDGAQPFFSWIGYIKPHHPFDPPGRYAELYDPS
ncbi:MAG TPA: sulfatase-like hydrolase/transferase, partial [Candidatus Latescibacteria bacterium]|nr:sulfatase-like hydrolase/transferase [Candidatus Latescibacterota bacterium]